MCTLSQLYLNSFFGLQWVFQKVYIPLKVCFSRWIFTTIYNKRRICLSLSSFLSKEVTVLCSSLWLSISPVSKPSPKMTIVSRFDKTCFCLGRTTPHALGFLDIVKDSIGFHLTVDLLTKNFDLNFDFIQLLFYQLISFPCHPLNLSLSFPFCIPSLFSLAGDLSAILNH